MRQENLDTQGSPIRLLKMAAVPVAALLLSCFAAGCGHRPPEPAGRVVTLKGSVTAVSSNARNGLRAGDLVLPGVLLVAGKDSFCDVQVKDAVVRLKQESRLSFLPGTAGFSGVLELLSGKILVRRDRVSSPGILGISFLTARIGFVDTEAIVETVADAGGRVTIGRGNAEIRLSSSESPVVLSEGAKAVVRKGKFFKKAFGSEDRLALEELRELRQERDFLDPAASRILTVDTGPGNAEVYLNGSFLSFAPFEAVVSARRKTALKAVLPGYSSPVTNLSLKKSSRETLSILIRLSSVTQEQHECMMENDSISFEPLFGSNALYIVENGMVLRKFSADRAGVLEEKAVFETGRRMNRPVLWNGRIHLGSADGYFYALDAGSMKTVWKKKLGDVERSLPVVEDGVMYLGSASGFFYSLDTSDGFVKWQFRSLSPVLSSAAVADEMVCFAAADRSLYGLDKATGTLLWRVPMERQADPVSPLFVADRFIVLNSAGGFFCVNPRGKIVYSRFTRERFVRAFLAGEDRIFVGSASGRVQCFDRQSGRPIWQSDLKSPVTSGFLAFRGGLFVGLADGRVVRLDPRNGNGSPEGGFPGRVKFISYFDRTVYVTTANGIYKL